MNLMKSFNFKYLKQNLKKSKITLAFVLLILPILNLIIFLMSSTRDSIQVFNLTDVSALTVLGMYILPIVLSIILFSFVFKKKSIDFMGSMPIDRKTIFVTNTVGGVLIILLLLIVTTLLMAGASFAISNIYVPIGVFFDYLILFFVSYTFVFSSCNLAMSVSGNITTTLVVTALILFFIPYHHFIYGELLGKNNYQTVYYNCPECDVNEYFDWRCDENDSKCREKIIRDRNYITDLKEVYQTPSYTLPSNILLGTLVSNDSETIAYENSMIGKMALISVLYMLIGCSLFEKRKMEVCETSFKEFRTHQIVKVLTLIPIISFATLILEYSSSIAWVFAFCLILVYNFVYDLVTRHSIEKISKNILTYLITFVLVVAVVCNFLQSNDSSITIENTFTASDVEKTYVTVDSFNTYGTGEYVEIKDNVLTKKILQGLYPKKEDEDYYYIPVQLKINGRLYEGDALVSKDTYNDIERIIKNSSIYKNISLKEKVKNSEIITVSYDYAKISDESLKILENITVEENVLTDNELYVNIYTYENHELKKFRISSGISTSLRNSIIKQLNEQTQNLKLNDAYYIDIKNISNGEYLYIKNSDYESLFLSKVLQQKNIDWNEKVYKISIHSRDKQYYYFANLTENMMNYLVHEDDSYGY